jgi:radical SAM protein with 4Fe4S-binding SPASM domain
MLSPQQYEHILRDIYALENRGEIQVKVTCGPHYERVKRQVAKGARGSGAPPTHNSVFGDLNVKAEGLGDGSAAPGRSHGHVPSRGCLAGLGVLFISHRGDVYPCGYLPVNCGNILQKRLIEIWDESKDLARMRDAGALEGKCGVCEYRQVCGGCRARAFGMTGNYMGEEPFCAYDPRAAQRPRDKVNG